mmetsp:Transcript_11283/g.37113  ORF Transcript_11283/g.37113 Transcript_11283/m.37113 type:complete len:212 (-) Transcript_11283:630-1265(-)
MPPLLPPLPLCAHGSASENRKGEPAKSSSSRSSSTPSTLRILRTSPRRSFCMRRACTAVAEPSGGSSLKSPGLSCCRLCLKVRIWSRKPLVSSCADADFRIPGLALACAAGSSSPGVASPRARPSHGAASAIELAANALALPLLPVGGGVANDDDDDDDASGEVDAPEEPASGATASAPRLRRRWALPGFVEGCLNCSRARFARSSASLTK